MTPEEMLKANAELVIKTMSGHFDGMGYNRESVEWLQGFIERQRSRDDIEPDTISGFGNTLGSFLGQVIIENIGGIWRQINGQWVVFFSKDFYAFPFAQVSKQFANGVDGGDSILGFYDAARALARRSEKRRWWKFW